MLSLPDEIEAVLANLKTPEEIQTFVDNIPYAWSGEVPGDYNRSVRQVFNDGKCDCVGGALIAAYCLEKQGYGPGRVVGLAADRKIDDDHLIAVYKVGNLWGAISKSAYPGCRGRDPVYSSLRELVMSYFDFYVNAKGQKSLRGFSAPVFLDRTDPDRHWVFQTKPEGSGKVCRASDKIWKKVLVKNFRKSRCSTLIGDTFKQLVPHGGYPIARGDTIMT